MPSDDMIVNGNNCYAVILAPVAHGTAVADCAAHVGHLVFFEEQPEQDWFEFEMNSEYFKK